MVEKSHESLENLNFLKIISGVIFYIFITRKFQKKTFFKSDFVNIFCKQKKNNILKRIKYLVK